MNIIEQGSQVVADWVIQFGKVLGSSIAESAGGTSKPVQYHVVGISGWDLTGDEPAIDEEDTSAEVSPEADVYSALGVTGRPLQPDITGDASEHAEVVCIRSADGLTPIAVRDVRLRMGGNAPNEGTVALVGYGGGYHSISPVDNTDLSKGAIQVIYCPYDFNAAGVAQKAHAITLDPTPGNESISLVHGEGMAITMSGAGKKALMLNNAAGDATFRLDDDGITMTAVTIVCSGGVIVGEPITAVPLLAGAASPASTKFYVSP
jgi:hypothetical protein